jgi:hypothetical protein
MSNGGAFLLDFIEPYNDWGQVMSRIKHRSAFVGGALPLLLAIGFVILTSQLAHADDSPLRFFKSYNITGDYVVAGKSLWRKGVNGEVVSVRRSSGSKRRMVDAPPCWSVIVVGGRKLVTYRADVLPYFRKDPTTLATLGSLVNGKQTVEVPDAGSLFGDDDEVGVETGNVIGPRAIGASLVVIYSDPDPATVKYKSIVIYDAAKVV